MGLRVEGDEQPGTDDTDLTASGAACHHPRLWAPPPFLGASTSVGSEEWLNDKDPGSALIGLPGLGRATSVLSVV